MMKHDELRKEYNNLNQELVLSQVKTGELVVLYNKLDDGTKNAQIKIQELYNKNKQLIDIFNETKNNTQNLKNELIVKNKECEKNKLQNELDKKLKLHKY